MQKIKPLPFPYITHGLQISGNCNKIIFEIKYEHLKMSETL